MKSVKLEVIILFAIIKKQQMNDTKIIHIKPVLTQEQTEKHGRMFQKAFDLVCKNLKLAPKQIEQRIQKDVKQYIEIDNTPFFDNEVFILDSNEKMKAKVILYKAITKDGNIKLESQFLDKKDMIQVSKA